MQLKWDFKSHTLASLNYSVAEGILLCMLLGYMAVVLVQLSFAGAFLSSSMMISLAIAHWFHTLLAVISLIQYVSQFYSLPKSLPFLAHSSLTHTFSFTHTFSHTLSLSRLQHYCSGHQQDGVAPLTEPPQVLLRFRSTILIQQDQSNLGSSSSTLSSCRRFPPSGSSVS